jgi:hypothetical protein
MNTQVTLASILARSVHEDDWRRAEEWRRLHRRPDALPLPPEHEPETGRWGHIRLALRRVAGLAGA